MIFNKTWREILPFQKLKQIVFLKVVFNPRKYKIATNDCLQK